MATCLMEGRIYHIRTKSSASLVQHSFAYSVWLAFIDLEQVEQGNVQDNWFCSFTPQHSLALAKFRRSDYYYSRGSKDNNAPLSEAIKQLVNEHFPELDLGKVYLLTNLSILGLYNFNSVSVYYCYSRTAKLVACVLEVSNTPWLDKRCYVLRMNHSSVTWEKDFHVSPFMDLDHTYNWKISNPLEHQQEIKIEAISHRRSSTVAAVSGTAPICPRIANDDGSKETTFVVNLRLSPVPLRSAWRVILGNPIMPLMTMLWIHIHALRVWIKGAPYVNPPAANSRELGIMDLCKHLFLFALAIGLRYGLPTYVLVKALKRLGYK